MLQTGAMAQPLPPMGNHFKPLMLPRASAYKYHVAKMMRSRNESFKAALNRLALMLIFDGSLLSNPTES